MKLKVLTCLLFSCLFKVTVAQQAYDVIDSIPVNINGLIMGYHINSEEVKAVGDKGNFSRFSIKFYVTNNTADAKIILHNTGFNLLNDISDNIARFDCANATGARLTSKSVLLSAPVCRILANVEDKDPAGKTIINKRLVEAGYWIRAGETINATAIMIVPLNQKPIIRATYLMYASSPVAAVAFAQPNDLPPPPPQPVGYIVSPGYFNVRNSWKNTYFNYQATGLNCSSTDIGQFNAQWQFIPVPGSNCYLIKNRWQNMFVSCSRPGPVELSNDNRFAGSLWTIEPVTNTQLIRLKNAGNGTYLNIEYGSLQSTPLWDSALRRQMGSRSEMNSQFKQIGRTNDQPVVIE